MSFEKGERTYFNLCNMMRSEFPSSELVAPNFFRVCKNKEGSKVPYRIEYHKDLENKTIKEIVAEFESRIQGRNNADEGVKW